MILEEEHFKHGEIRVNCKGTIRAEFWKKDVENILFNDQDRFLKVLEITESQWPSKYIFSLIQLGTYTEFRFLFSPLRYCIYYNKFHI